MKKLSVSKVLILLPTLFLTACGYGLKEIYKGVPYASYNFEENYYNVWDKEINYNNEKSITEKVEARVLDDVKDFVFTRLENSDYEESYTNFKTCESNWASYAYTYDKDEPEQENLHAYGPAVALGKIDKSFKYGVVSKLFDGQMFCNGDFQNSRTQVGSTSSKYSGFSVKFAKECSYSEYFMMNFKCSVITTENQNLGRYESDLTLRLGFYLRNNNGYTYVPVTYVINDVPTNSGDDHFLPPYSGRLDSYICFGFKLHATENDNLLDLTRLAGISFEYELNKVHKKSGEEFDTTPDNVMHSIMLYEISLPHSTWH